MTPYLTIYDGQLLVNDAGTALQLSDSVIDPCCCGGDISIEICNSNGITDDDWRVELNGRTIGTHSAPLNAVRGTIFRTKSGIPGLGCGPTYINFPSNYVQRGTNNILMTITKLYFAANFGTIRVVRWTKNAAGTYIYDGLLLDSTYTGPSTLGFTNSFSFTFP
jgi:hypothetical protein